MPDENLLIEDDEGNVGRGADQYPLRFPPGMRDAIKEAAKANGRSMNAEIVAALDRHVEAGERSVQMKIRIPAVLHKQLEDAAWADRRSMNMLVLMILEAAMAARSEEAK